MIEREIRRWGAAQLSVIVVSAAAAALGGCAHDSSVRTAAAERTVASLEVKVAELQTMVSDASAGENAANRQRDRAMSARDDARAAIALAEIDRATADSSASAARAERDAVLMRFDPEIKAAVAELQVQAQSAACDVATALAVAGATAPTVSTALVGFSPSISALHIPGGELLSVLDATSIEQSIADCFAAGINHVQQNPPYVPGPP